MRRARRKAIKGDWNATCDVCGFKYKASDLQERWDGLMVCDEDWEERHPQDFLRESRVEDDQSVPWSRPQGDIVQVDGLTGWIDTSEGDHPSDGTFDDNNGTL